MHLAHLAHTESMLDSQHQMNQCAGSHLESQHLGGGSRGSRVQDLIPLHTEFEDSLEYMRL